MGSVSAVTCSVAESSHCNLVGRGVCALGRHGRVHSHVCNRLFKTTLARHGRRSARAVEKAASAAVALFRGGRIWFIIR